MSVTELATETARENRLFEFTSRLRTLLATPYPELRQALLVLADEYSASPRKMYAWTDLAMGTLIETVSLFARSPDYMATDESVRETLNKRLFCGDRAFLGLSWVLPSEEFPVGIAVVDALQADDALSTLAAIASLAESQTGEIPRDILLFFRKSILAYMSNLGLTEKAVDIPIRRIKECLNGGRPLLVGFELNLTSWTMEHAIGFDETRRG